MGLPIPSPIPFKPLIDSLTGGVHTAQKQLGGSKKLYDILAAGGWSQAQIPTAAAIALAESGGVVNAVNNKNGDGTEDDGLMQINSVHKQFDRKKLLSDPVYNARAGKIVYLGAGASFKPWTMYKNQTYLKFMGQNPTISWSGGAVQDAAGNLGLPIPDVPSNPLDGIAAVGKAVQDIANLMISLTTRDTWFRIAKVSGGSILIIAGTTTLLVIAVDLFSDKGASDGMKAGARGTVRPVVKAATKAALLAPK